MNKFTIFTTIFVICIIGAFTFVIVNDNTQKIAEAQDKISTNKKTAEEVKSKNTNTVAAKKGDTVTIDYVGTTDADGYLFDGGSATDYELELGSNSFIDGFEDQVVGHKVGENFDVKVTFPSDYSTKTLQNQKATFNVTLKNIKAAK